MKMMMMMMMGNKWLTLCYLIILQNGFTLSLEDKKLERVTDTSSADIMARNILEWIQGIYRQGIRKTRQESTGYLPPYGTSQRPPEKPRPFQPASPPYGPPISTNEVTNYPGYPSSFPTNSNNNKPSKTPPTTVTNYPTSPKPTYIPVGPNAGQSPAGGYPSSPPRPFGGASSPSYPTSTTYLPPSSTYGYPSSPSPSPGYSTPGSTDSYGYPSPNPYPGFPTPPGGNNNQGSSPGSSRPSPGPSRPTPGPSRPSPGPSRPTPGPSPTPGGPTSSPGNGPTNGPAPMDDDDSKHPPHIHELQVECSKTMMTINIEFNREFNGVIYSKGFYMMPECRYVAENSGQTKYSFTVNLDSCGTEFINDFEGEAGQAYLENVLVLQNEQGIQEVWDTVRRVRCLWEGNINKALTVSLSVDMLNQEIVTFSGDTATAKLDVQVGKGPFAPAATGLVKIGEPMTLVVSVEGDPGFDLLVRDCVARDESSTNVVQLTDERGCILKPKLFGAFQTTKDTGNTGATVISYAFFQAFKFPDVMDLFIECNVELCKTDCQACPEANQQIEPGRRRRRDVSYLPGNYTSPGALSEPVRMGRRFKVIMPDDLVLPPNELIEDIKNTEITEISLSRNVCLTYSGFYTTFILMLGILVVTTISAATLYIKVQRLSREKDLKIVS